MCRCPSSGATSALVDPRALQCLRAGGHRADRGVRWPFWSVLIRRAVKGQKGALPAWLLHVAVLVVWGYAGVCALWGTQHYGTSFAGRAGMQSPAVSVEQLAAVARRLRRPRQRDSRCCAPGRKQSVCGGENRNFAKLHRPAHAAAGALAVSRTAPSGTRNRRPTPS